MASESSAVIHVAVTSWHVSQCICGRARVWFRLDHVTAEGDFIATLSEEWKHADDSPACLQEGA